MLRSSPPDAFTILAETATAEPELDPTGIAEISQLPFYAMI